MSSHKKLKIGVIFGGRSSEHEVSLVSARSVIENLDNSRYQAVPIRISKRGEWAEWLKNFGNKPDPAPRAQGIWAGFLDKESAPPTYLSDCPLTLPRHGGAGYSRASNKQKIDVYFPLIHGRSGEDGILQGFLELTGKPYVGCGVLASALGMDKVIQKQLFKEQGLPIVDFIWFSQAEWQKSRSKILRRIESGTKKEQRIGYPCFVKPANLGSSVGITKAHNRTELIQGILEAWRYDLKILIEAAVEPARELEVAVLGNDKPQVSGVGEIIPSKEFYDYEAKYVDGGSLTKIPAEVPRVVAATLANLAKKAFIALDGAGLARVDFLMNKQTGQIYLNEINTMPGFTSISMYPKLWAQSGLSYSQLLDELIRLAVLRFKERAQLKQLYEPSKKWWG